MPFPESERVIYGKNPLQEVICQLRYPSILRIDAQPPADFQDRIRRELPEYSEVRESPTDFGLPTEIAKLVQEHVPLSTGKMRFSFASSDSRWKAVLTRDFLALTDSRYERWEHFKGRLTSPIQALEKVYEPAFYSRIGLRYRDVLQRSRLGLDDHQWTDLLQPHIAGELTNRDVASAIEDASRQLVVRLDRFEARVRLQHGIAQAPDSTEKCFVIDADFYTEQRTERTHAFEALDYFNRLAGRLFRWCITPRLHKALEPHTP